MAESVALETSSTTVPEAADVALTTDESSRSLRFRHFFDRLSQSRQIFCLFCVFDFLFTFFLWIIYAQGVSVDGLDDSLSSEIRHYGISSSLFDIVCISLIRVCILLVAYGYRIHSKAYAIIFTTSTSTIYLIVKACMYEFEEKEGVGNRPVDYLLHVASFLLCWAEAWYFLVRVLPREKKKSILKDAVVPTYGAIPIAASTAYSVLSFHTADRDSENEEEAVRATLKYIEMARKTTSKALNFLYAQKQWDEECKQRDVLIESTTDENLGKIVRVRTFLDASPEIVYALVYGDVQNHLSWNTSLRQSEVIYTVNSTTDITYTCMGELVGGFISARDYVNLRHFQRVGSMYLSTSSAITIDLKPPVDGIIRGESLLNCFALSAVEDDPNKSEFAWIITTTLKPSGMPQMIVDRGMPSYLFDCMENLKKCCEAEKINANNGNTR